MAEKTRRRLMLEQSLAEDPIDTFLRYGLAVQCLREGDVEEGRARLLALISDHPNGQVAAYQQLGQSYAESGEVEAATTILRAGIDRARVAADEHAAVEMEQLLGSLS
jgi:predicted Zn-dependent protease